MEVEIKKEFLESCGSSSLQGLLYESGVREPQPVTLVFQQTSFAWRQRNGGPELYIVPEFMPFCLIESILKLVGNGYQIEVRWQTS